MTMQGVVQIYIKELTASGLKESDIANVLQVSLARVRQWKAGEAHPYPNQELVLSNLRYVSDRLRDYYSVEYIRTWLHASQRLLEGERAVDLIHDGRTEEVLVILNRLENDVYL